MKSWTIQDDCCFLYKLTSEGRASPPLLLGRKRMAVLEGCASPTHFFQNLIASISQAMSMGTPPPRVDESLHGTDPQFVRSEFLMTCDWRPVDSFLQVLQKGGTSIIVVIVYSHQHPQELETIITNSWDHFPIERPLDLCSSLWMPGSTWYSTLALLPSKRTTGANDPP